MKIILKNHQNTNQKMQQNRKTMNKISKYVPAFEAVKTAKNKTREIIANFPSLYSLEFNTITKPRKKDFVLQQQQSNTTAFQ